MPQPSNRKVRGANLKPSGLARRGGCLFYLGASREVFACALQVLDLEGRLLAGGHIGVIVAV